MKLKAQQAPHIRHHESARSLMLDAILAMLFLYGMAYFYYGPRVVALGAVCVGAAVLTDVACTLLARRKLNPRDLSPVVTGMLIPLLAPASIEYHVVVIAVVFGLTVAKHPFGGVGHNVFNPAAAGFSFAAITFADKLFLYPLPLDWLPVAGPVETTLVSSPAFTLALGGIPPYSLVEMSLGRCPGPMGATNILVILACLLYLVLRNTVRWETPVFFFATVGLISLLFPRMGTQLDLSFFTRLRLTGYEFMSGFLLLGGIFLLGDPVTSPKRDRAKLAFAVASGVVVMLFRRFGGFEESFTFAVLLLNATVWGFDMICEKFARTRRNRQNPA